MKRDEIIKKWKKLNHRITCADHHEYIGGIAAERDALAEKHGITLEEKQS